MGRVLSSVVKLYSCLLCFDGFSLQVKKFISLFGQTTYKICIFSTLSLQRELNLNLDKKRVQTTP